MDPAFWYDRSPAAAGGGDPTGGWLGTVPGLAGHLVFGTSGSSGAPKWIALSKDALRISAAVVNAHLGVEPDDCWGLLLPLHHVGGFGVVVRAHEAACALRVFSPRWDPVAAAGWLDAAGVTHTSMVPTQVIDLVRAGLRAPARLRAVVVGGGRLDETAGARARALGWPVLASYGMTETASQIATQALADLDLPYRPAPLPLLPVWRATTTADGRLRVAGPALFSGTVAATAASGWTYLPRTGEWHDSSDLAEVRDDAVTPLGRADTRVKILGELVDPAALESDLLARLDLPPGSFAIAAVADERAGHRLVPVADRRVDRDALAAALGRHNATCAGHLRLPPARFLDSLPLSGLGKILRAELAELAAPPQP